MRGASEGKSGGSGDQGYTHSLILYHRVYKLPGSQQKLKGVGVQLEVIGAGLSWMGFVNSFTYNPFTPGKEEIVSFLCVFWGHLLLKTPTLPHKSDTTAL